MRTILILSLFVSPFSDAGKSTIGFIYTDGNNNTYTLTNLLLAYDAIQPNESSSGEYSGGTDQTKELSKETSTTLNSLANQVMQDKTSHIKTREMGCGTLTIGKKTVFIRSNADLKNQLETKLKEALQ